MDIRAAEISSILKSQIQNFGAEAQVPAAIADYGRLESAGWKSDTGTAVHPDNAQGRFYTALLADFITAGRGAIYRYWYGDTVVAMDLCIEGAEEMIILKTTYDESIRDTSPAFLMRHLGLRNTEGRLRLLYGDAASLQVESGGASFLVRLELPSHAPSLT